ncbi:hypothetical protein EVAR_23626_1 [Eumeta japonica]|uniref:Uncharacterized protein n=1 Tax=Eumeta variegata TaxID=151549 RepID=A0A4C1VID2_EUMVA|nr:hypothetical protein EVAR_23626_1 [Eumeta japonica]
MDAGNKVNGALLAIMNNKSVSQLGRLAIYNGFLVLILVLLCTVVKEGVSVTEEKGKESQCSGDAISTRSRWRLLIQVYFVYMYDHEMNVTAWDGLPPGNEANRYLSFAVTRGKATFTKANGRAVTARAGVSLLLAVRNALSGAHATAR